MSRLRMQETLTERLEEVRERLSAAYDQFRESRLYVQTICAAVLVGAAWLIHVLPYGPLERVDAAVTWVVQSDYDFAGKARQTGAWAKERGGWGLAAAGLWQQGVDRVKDWVGPVGPFAPKPAATMGPIDQAAGNAPPQEEIAPPAAAPGEGAQAAPPGLTQPPLQPVEGSVLAEYGWLPQTISEEFHEGLDFFTPVGATVVAVQDGTVQAIRQDQGLGTVVEVRHGTVVAVYGQVEAVVVRAGDQVKRGEKLAVVAPPRGAEQGMPPHLHFEIRPVSTGEPVDPASYLGLGGKKL